MSVYYNEYDAYPARWLQNLSEQGHIAKGVVDDRSILDVRAADLVGYDQAHFFAGIGVWSRALRDAGVPDDFPVWTGSCPCQPFSVAGRGGGFDDERHLWPVWFELIKQRRPPIVFGEQVASPDGLKWLDAVQADLEGAGYAFGASDLCAAGVGAPHIRQRLFFVAYAHDAGPQGRVLGRVGSAERAAGAGGVVGGAVAHGSSNGRREECSDAGRQSAGDRQEGRAAGPESSGGARLVGNAGSAGPQGRIGSGDLELHRGAGAVRPTPPTGVSGFWKDAEWIPCRDGKWRPVEPGTFPLAHGAPARVGRLRAYGNAIVAPVAATFVRAAMESLGFFGSES